MVTCAIKDKTLAKQMGQKDRQLLIYDREIQILKNFFRLS